MLMRSAVLHVTYKGRWCHSGCDMRGQTAAKLHMSAVPCLNGQPSRSSTATRLCNISDTLRRARKRARQKHELCRLGVLLKAPTEQKQRRRKKKRKNNLHNPAPVVTGRHSEECEEGHAKVVKGSVAAQTFTGVFF